MSELRFDGRSVIVTGAGRGVGRGYALLLASRGAQVVVADFGGELDGSGSSPAPAEEVVKEIEAAGGTAVACCESVAGEAGAASIVATALDAFGRLDAVINNAGISDPERFENLSIAQFRRMLDVHYLGTLYVLKAAWPHLRASGSGRVVNTTSEAVGGIQEKLTSYGAAKGGVLGLTFSLATEHKSHGIRVNGIAPRAATRLADPALTAEALGISLEDATAIMAPFAPEAVAPVGAFLAHESCELNGVVLVTGAGQVQRMAIMESPGAHLENLTIEDVAANIAVVTDMSGAQVLTSL
jgi:NAD(P)-dependent dehydrogenase (short-subunit alcohol dehydrogenase family)